MTNLKSERELAIEVVKTLDGVPIDKARNALEHAAALLSTSQIVATDTRHFRSMLASLKTPSKRSRERLPIHRH
jgi:hypothetical protein